MGEHMEPNLNNTKLLPRGFQEEIFFFSNIIRWRTLEAKPNNTELHPRGFHGKIFFFTDTVRWKIQQPQKEDHSQLQQPMLPSKALWSSLHCFRIQDKGHLSQLVLALLFLSRKKESQKQTIFPIITWEFAGSTYRGAREACPPCTYIPIKENVKGINYLKYSQNVFTFRVWCLWMLNSESSTSTFLHTVILCVGNAGT